MKGYCRAPSHCGRLPCPVAGSIHAYWRPSPIDVPSGALGIFSNNFIHTRSAPVAPHKCVGWLSSRPIQVTARRSPVKPENHESRWWSEVPVLPATFNDARDELPIGAAVPYSVACCIIQRTSRSGCWYSPLPCLVAYCFSTRPLASSTPRNVSSGNACPSAAKNSYNCANWNGDMSTEPSSSDGFEIGRAHV